MKQLKLQRWEVNMTDLFKQYKSLMQRGIDDVNSISGAISPGIISDLRSLSLKTKKMLSKNTPAAAINNYVRNWLQLK